MKKLVIVLGFVFSLASVQKSGAQIRINANINIGSQPLWGPSGYDYVDYYYLPDADVYYYVPERRFIYLDGGRWIFAASLPARFGNINLYTSPKIIINEPQPYLRADVYRVKYKNWKGPKQIVIRDSDDARYRNHPGRAVGHSKGKGKGKG
ncbi:MAG: hypothetical protein ACOYVG_11675 [Bacteroidota bacterium]|jgi:hypothetical protein